MNRYVFINAENIVVQIIIGNLNEQQQTQFLNDYSTLFGATQIVVVDDETSVWINGSYIDGTFTAPPEPILEVIAEPVLESLPEVITESIA